MLSRLLVSHRRRRLKSMDEVEYRKRFPKADTSKYPIAILATTVRAGTKYAKALGIENYKVVTNKQMVEGLRYRTLVITPGYVAKLENWVFEAFRLFEETNRFAWANDTVPLG